MPIKSPISFDVVVTGKLQKATVIEELDYPVQHAFRVRFSDGFEDNFYLDEDGLGAEREDAQPYVKALREDLVHVIGLDTDKFYYIFREIVAGAMTNIWVKEKTDSASNTVYAVYYNEFYRFELKKSGNKWIAYSKSEPEKIN